MRTAMRSAWKSAAGFAVAALVCVFALAWAVATPAVAHAIDADPAPSEPGITIGQEFTTTGFIPSTVTGDFTYEIQAQGDAPLPGGANPYTFTLNGNDAELTLPIEFAGHESGADALVFRHAGVFEYDIECTTKGDDRLTVDTVRYHVSIVISNVAGDPGLALDTIVVKDVETGDKPALIMFKHSYEGTPVSVVGFDPPVKKSISGGTPAENATFRFDFVPDDPSYPMPDGSSNGRKTVQVIGANEVEIGQITFREPGTYTYRVHELDDGLADYSYDASEYTVTFKVTEERDVSLSLERVFTKDGVEVGELESFEFTNDYSGEEANPIQQVINKVLPMTGDPASMLVVISIALVAGVTIAIVASVARRRQKR